MDRRGIELNLLACLDALLETRSVTRAAAAAIAAAAGAGAAVRVVSMVWHERSHRAGAHRWLRQMVRETAELL